MRNLNHCWPRVTWKHQHRLPVKIGISLRHHRLSAAGDDELFRGMVGMVWGPTFNRWIIHQLIMMYTCVYIYIHNMYIYCIYWWYSFISSKDICWWVLNMLIPVRWMCMKIGYIPIKPCHWKTREHGVLNHCFHTNQYCQHYIYTHKISW